MKPAKIGLDSIQTWYKLNSLKLKCNKYALITFRKKMSCKFLITLYKTAMMIWVLG